MKFISLFAGIGGFDLALERQGHECVWANEWDKYAAQIYDKNFNDANKNREQESIGERTIGEHIRHTGDIPNSNVWRGKSKQKEGHRLLNGLYISKSKNYETKIDTRDIRTVPTEEIPDHDLLVGGFPCQAFSIAGKRKGFDDTRGTLFFEIARILREKHPRLFILENVKGLLSHDNGNTFKTIISTLDELGYDLQWQVLNSKNFGVPQNRERVFIIGNLRGTSRPEVFPITENNSEDIVLPTVTTRVTADSNGTYVCKRQTYKALTERRTEEAKKLRRLGIVKDTRNLKELTPIEDGMANTVTTGDIKNQSLTNGLKIRRLTPTECERLQGFPEVEKYSIIEVCKRVNASGVESHLNIKVIDKDNVVLPNVLIDCVENGVEIHSQEKLLLAKQEDKKEWIRCEKCGEHINFKITPTPSPLDSIEEVEEIKGCFSEHTLSDKINSLIRNQTKIINYLKNKQ